MVYSIGCIIENNFSDLSFFWEKMVGYLLIILSLVIMIIILKNYFMIKFRIFFLLMFIFLLGIVSLRIYCWVFVYNLKVCILMENNVIKEYSYNEDNVSLRLIKNVVYFFKYRVKNNVLFFYIMFFF